MSYELTEADRYIVEQITTGILPGAFEQVRAAHAEALVRLTQELHRVERAVQMRIATLDRLDEVERKDA